MRIISQRGVSIDFDSSIVLLSGCTIMANVENRDLLLGNYKSDDDALHVFMDIHKQWETDCMSVYEMPVE